MARFPNAHFSIGYGLSEIAPAITTMCMDTNEHVLYTIGLPCDDVRVMIQDAETGRECGAGETGEILLKSPNLMVCYYKLAIDKQPIDGNGWLHTGDLGCVMEDGYIRLTGRIKDLIIRGGENITPSEVAEAIAAHPAIADVKVFGVPSAIWGEEVAAAIIRRPGESLSSDDLQEYLKTRLARFKIPAHLIFVDAFPLLANGKVDMIGLKKAAEAMLGAIK